jgi:cytosine/adenosine deaminase-related metal-dependent hydrolase
VGNSAAWLLAGARVALGALDAEALDVEIREGRVFAFHPRGRATNDSPTSINLEGRLILPGLINAHDHLEFALFPRLGSKRYPNAKAWAEDIYRPGETPVREHLRIPKTDRLLWGGLKNLLSGVTTVCHHNPYEPAFDGEFPVRVVKRFGWAHSLDFSTDVAERFQNTPPGEPFIVHLGEGTDASARDEIFELDRLGALSDRTVLVHAVALDDRGLALVRERGASIIWCPSSNMFTLGKTLDRRVWDADIPVALATDSSISTEGTLLDEIRAARQASGLRSDRLYSMVTDSAARILRLTDGEGTLGAGGLADLFCVPDRGLTPSDALANLTNEDVDLVMLGGEINLLSDQLAGEVAVSLAKSLGRITMNSRPVWVAGFDASRLLGSARSALGEAGPIRLAGRMVEA